MGTGTALTTVQAVLETMFDEEGKEIALKAFPVTNLANSLRIPPSLESGSERNSAGWKLLHAGFHSSRQRSSRALPGKWRKTFEPRVKVTARAHGQSPVRASRLIFRFLARFFSTTSSCRSACTFRPVPSHVSLSFSSSSGPPREPRDRIRAEGV